MKNILFFVVIPATILYRKVAGFAVQGLKQIWNNWQWVLPVGALALSVVTWYYKTSTETPARVDACEKHLQEHIAASNVRFEKIENAQNEISVSLAELKAMTAGILNDTNILKRYVVDEAHKQ